MFIMSTLSKIDFYFINLTNFTNPILSQLNDIVFLKGEMLCLAIINMKFFVPVGPENL